MNFLYENASAHDALEFACRSQGEVFAVNKLVGLLILGVLGYTSGGALAQDLFESQTNGELPPQFTFDALEGPAAPGMERMMLPPDETIPEPIAEPLSTPLGSDAFEPGAVDYAEDESRIFNSYPALLESTGTWLRRGFWYAEADAVIFSRSFDNNAIVLATEQSFIPPQIRANTLEIDGSSGAEGAPRLNVGRFLFRDHENRDHTAEFTIFGGGNWGQTSQLSGAFLQMPISITNGNPGFDGAQDMQYDYLSWFNSFELTYNVKQRMGKDRMELEPSGHWVRRAQPTHTNAFLAGVRYFSLDEDLDIMAFGIPDGNMDGNNETGEYNVQTGNRMIGTELGYSRSYETSRWSLTGRVKGGMFLNMVHLESNFNVTGNVTSGSTDLEGDNLSFIGEAALIGKWHLRPNLSLRTSLEVLQVTGLALAPNQVDFVPSGSPFIGNGADVYYLGGAIGFESYW